MVVAPVPRFLPMISEISNPLADQIATLKAVISKLPAKDVEFATSLVKQFTTKGSLSDKQAPWVAKLIEKAQPAHTPTAPKPSMPVAPGAFQAFYAAVPAGAVKPAVVLAIREDADDVEDRRALRIAKVPGKQYLRLQFRADVKCGDWIYVGALREDSTISYSHESKWLKGFDRNEATILLELFGEQMVDVIAKTGIYFGICANCGKTLTHPVSVKLGIGPVCVHLFPSLAKTYASAMALYVASEKAVL